MPRKPWFGIAVALVLVVPLAPLILLHASFDGDWYTHLWFIGTTGKYFAAHGALPPILYTNEMGALPFPLFYGTTLYPLLGIFSIFAGPQLAIRIAAALLYLAEFLLLCRLLYRLVRDRTFAFCVAAWMVWAIYPMTSFYNRAAVPEFFATGSLVCAFCATALLLLSEQYRSRTYYEFSACFWLTLALGSHPITALYGGIFLVASLGALFRPLTEHQSRFQRRKLIWTSASIAAFVSLCLAPWLYATLSFLGKLPAAHQQLYFYPENIDAVWTRFQLFPFDKRSLLQGQNVVTNYLDTQIVMPLLFFLLGLAILERREIAARWKAATVALKLPLALSTAGFFLMSWMSLSEVPYRLLPECFKVVQFLYRLITYQNLWLLSALISLVFLAPKGFAKITENRAKLALLAACTTLAFTGALEKYTHAMAGRDPRPMEYDFHRDPRTYDTSLYITQDVASLAEGTPTKGSAIFEANPGSDFDVPYPQLLNLTMDGWVATNIAPFSWLGFELDGKPVPRETLRSLNSKFAVYAPAGRHLLRLVFNPPSGWVFARWLAVFALLSWLLNLGWVFVSPKNH